MYIYSVFIAVILGNHNPNKTQYIQTFISVINIETFHVLPLRCSQIPQIFLENLNERLKWVFLTKTCQFWLLTSFLHLGNVSCYMYWTNYSQTWYKAALGHGIQVFSTTMVNKVETCKEVKLCSIKFAQIIIPRSRVWPQNGGLGQMFT